MRAVSRAMGDVLLGLFTVAVLVGAGLAVARQDDPPAASTFSASSSGQPTSTAASPSAPATRSASPLPSASGPVVLAGRDLAKLRAALAAELSLPVVVAGGQGPVVLPPGSLDEISGTPRAVVMQVLAGSKTSVRTTEAITAVRKKWPGVTVVVIGPFSSADRLSAAAVQGAAKLAKVTFLDPVTLKWRPVDTSAVLSAADLERVQNKLAAELR